MQAAALLNSLTHLLAHDPGRWHVLDTLHAMFMKRLVTLGGNDTVTTSLRDGLRCLAAYSASTSASASSYYRVRGSQHRAPRGTALSFAVLAAAHCGGGCQSEDVRRMQKSALAFFGTLSQPASPSHAAMRREVRDLAARVCASRDGCGSGALGCPCRLVLSTTMAGRLDMFEVLSGLGSGRCVFLACHTLPIGKVRNVIAGLCRVGRLPSASNSNTGFALSVRRRSSVTCDRDPESVEHSEAEIMLLSESTRERRYNVQFGMLRSGTEAFDRLRAAAHVWAQGGLDWSFTATSLGMERTDMQCVEKQNVQPVTLAQRESRTGCGQLQRHCTFAEVQATSLGYNLSSGGDKELVVFACLEKV